MAVPVFDDNSGIGSNAGIAISLSKAHTIGTGDNAWIIAVLCYRLTAGQTVSTITWTPSGGSAIAMPLVCSFLGQNNTIWGAIYALQRGNLVSGEVGTFDVLFSGSIPCMAEIQSWFEVDSVVPGAGIDTNYGSKAPGLNPTGSMQHDVTGVVQDEAIIGMMGRQYGFQVCTVTSDWPDSEVVLTNEDTSTVNGGSDVFNTCAMITGYWIETAAGPRTVTVDNQSDTDTRGGLRPQYNAVATAAKLLPSVGVSFFPVSDTFDTPLEAMQSIIPPGGHVVPVESIKLLESPRSIPVEGFKEIPGAQDVLVESSQGIAKSADVPVEGFGGVAPPHDVPVESIQSHAVAFVVPVESMQGVAEALVTPIEGMGGIGDRYDVLVEALGTALSVSSPHDIPVESLATLQPSFAVPVESVQGLARSLDVPVEGFALVSSGLVVPIESLQGLTQSRIVPVEGLGNIEQSRDVIIEALGGIAPPLSVLIESLQKKAIGFDVLVEAEGQVVPEFFDPVENSQFQLAGVDIPATLPLYHYCQMQTWLVSEPAIARLWNMTDNEEVTGSRCITTLLTLGVLTISGDDWDFVYSSDVAPYFRAHPALTKYRVELGGVTGSLNQPRLVWSQLEKRKW